MLFWNEKSLYINKQAVTFSEKFAKDSLVVVQAKIPTLCSKCTNLEFLMGMQGSIAYVP